MGFLGKRYQNSPPHQLGGLGSAVSFPSGVRDEDPAMWQFETFCRLTKPLLLPILLILVHVSEIFLGSGT